MKITETKDGRRIGVKSNGRTYTIRDDRSRFFFPNEWVNFLTAIKPDKHLLFNTLIQTGARIEEALNIKPKDFDFERNNLTLRVTKIKARKGEKIGKPRTFPVSKQYIKKVKAYILKHKIEENELLFKNASKYSVWGLLRRGLKKSNIKDDWNFGLHNIRKTHGNYLKALSVPAEEICLRLGHDFNTYLKHYGSPNIFTREDKVLIIKILGDLY